ncbi:50S ribosomal protein L28 [bacterium]|nr:50S ribosomal protein L28 [bacterium]
MAQQCMISGKKPRTANAVSHSHHKTKRVQNPNLQWKRFFLDDEKRYVRLRVSTEVLKTIGKYGLRETIRRYGADPALLRR